MANRDTVLLLVLYQVLDLELFYHSAKTDTCKVAIIASFVQFAAAHVFLEIGLEVKLELKVVFELFIALKHGCHRVQVSFVGEGKCGAHDFGVVNVWKILLEVSDEVLKDLRQLIDELLIQEKDV